MTTHTSTWHADVRNYEVDAQGIVNNAVYMNYLDNARVQYLHQHTIDWQDWHKQGIDIVLYSSELRYHTALHECDRFYITTSCTLSGRLKLVFNQLITNTADGSLVLHATNTVVCVDRLHNKPCLPNDIKSHLFD